MLLAAVSLWACLALLAPSARSATIGIPPRGAGIGFAGCEVVLINPFLREPGSCSMFATARAQVPRGKWRVRRITARIGPRTGPIRFTMIRAFRSRRGTRGVICCVGAARSRIFRPPRNRRFTARVSLKALNVVRSIDGEPVEVVDYLGISLLNRRVSVGFVRRRQPMTTYFPRAFRRGRVSLPSAIARPLAPALKARLRRAR